jgi:flagellar motor switch/type III secretory pathway protein FliN
LKAVRESYEAEKEKYKTDMDDLLKSKVQLQVELGNVIREKR